jgi:hypothetical protein
MIRLLDIGYYNKYNTQNKVSRRLQDRVLDCVRAEIDEFIVIPLRDSIYIRSTLLVDLRAKYD